MKIYTKTGDKGQTSLFDGTRVSKNNNRVNAYGTIDELNSSLGVVVSEIKNKSLKTITEEIQKDLLTIGAFLANPQAKFESREKLYFEERVKKFEIDIDTYTIKLTPLTNFILPGGGRVGALFHLARTVARRTEREIIGLSESVDVPREIIIYFNRLSDLLFTMARFANFLDKKKETIWSS